MTTQTQKIQKNSFPKVPTEVKLDNQSYVKEKELPAFTDEHSGNTLIWRNDRKWRGKQTWRGLF